MNGVNDNLGSAPQVNPFAYESETCSKCGNFVFQPALIFKMVPGLLVGEGNDKVSVPIKVACCSKCGELSPSDAKMLKEREDAAKQTANNKSGLII